MKIVVDSAIPYINGILEPYAEVSYISGGEISAEDVAIVDLLIVRTRTKCNAKLLDNSRVRMIATATIGVDHIDLDYCESRGIKVVNAAGCNARGVLQWFGAVMAQLVGQKGVEPADLTVGVVGVGHVGSLVAQYSRDWGFNVLCCDPPRAEVEGDDGFVSMEQIARSCDFVTFHTPLNESSRSVVCDGWLSQTSENVVILNSSRGEVVRGDDMLRSGRRFVFDVWEKEPHVDEMLVAKSEFATPHIAGYSKQGKANAVSMVVEQIAEVFDLPLRGWYPEGVAPSCPMPISWDELCGTIEGAFDIVAESSQMKSDLSKFESLRDNYPLRNEYF